MVKMKYQLWLTCISMQRITISDICRSLYIRIKNYISTEFKLNNKKMKHNFLKHKRKRYLFRYFRTGLRLTFLLYLIH